MYISAVLRMARNPHFWSPLRLKRIVCSIAENISQQIEIFRILSIPAFQNLVRSDPVFPFKYLSTLFLVKGLPPRQRASCFLHHYRQMRLRFSSDLLYRISHEEVAVLEKRCGDNVYLVTLGFPRGNLLWEGEILLRLQVNGAELYALQFTIVPGWLLASPDESILLVLRLQGVKGGFEQICSATKDFKEVAPPALLVAALQGFAEAWGVRQMAGVCARSQHSYVLNSDLSLETAYDDFFVELGAERVSPNFFMTSLPLPEKPIDRIGRSHRSRAKRKRAFKARIADEVCLNLLELSSASRKPARVSEKGDQVRPQTDACSVA